MSRDDLLKGELEQKSHQIWCDVFERDSRLFEAKEKMYYKRYRREIFPLELHLFKTWVASHKGSLGLEPSQTKLLFLLVGYSKEPSLLAAGLHEPEEIVLFHTGKGGTQDVAWELSLEIEKLEIDGLLKNPPKIHIPHPVHPPDPNDVLLPKHVFDRIQEEWEKNWQGEYDTEKEVVMDITGGKNTMVAGAFLAAAALKIPTYYLDFKEYVRYLRRPKPGTGFYSRFRPEELLSHLPKS